MDFLTDKPVFADVAEEFLAFIGCDPLVIHNASFDMAFINAELTRVGRTALPIDQSIDTLAMARKKFPGAQANLDALCRRFEIDNTHRTLHGALLDADLLARVYIELLGGRQPGCRWMRTKILRARWRETKHLKTHTFTLMGKIFAP